MTRFLVEKFAVLLSDAASVTRRLLVGPWRVRVGTILLAAAALALPSSTSSSSSHVDSSSYTALHHPSHVLFVSNESSSFQSASERQRNHHQDHHHPPLSSHRFAPSHSTRTSLPPLPPPLPPPHQLPLRFLRAGKGDPIQGLQRYEATLQWRKEQRIDTILRESFPHFALIKQHYPHFFHLRGHRGEPCFYEQPARTNLRALREGGVTLDGLLRHYAMVTEFLWQVIEPRDVQTSIYVIDLAGIRLTDFFGETIDFVKQAAGLSAQHYPERAGSVFVINVPTWFKLIWQVVRPIVDETTLQKIFILRGADEIRHQLMQRIPLANIPLEYGGTGLALGQAPEERLLANLMEHNNKNTNNNRIATHGQWNDDVHRIDTQRNDWDRWTPVRSY